ncbi:MAG: hypothetical protein ABI480_14250 [Chitinophagaceae bacterium]
MATIKKDILTFCDMIVRGFKEDKFTLDYSLTSFKDIDSFYDLHSKNGERVEGGRFSNNLGQILFALGSYIDQTIIKIVPGAVWEIDENDPEGEINAMLKLPDGTIVWPMQRTINRFRNGEEDGIYIYGYYILQTYVNIEKLLEQEQSKRNKKPWWKF